MSNAVARTKRLYFIFLILGLVGPVCLAPLYGAWVWAGAQQEESTRRTTAAYNHLHAELVRLGKENRGWMFRSEGNYVNIPLSFDFSTTPVERIPEYFYPLEFQREVARLFHQRDFDSGLTDPDFQTRLALAGLIQERLYVLFGTVFNLDKVFGLLAAETLILAWVFWRSFQARRLRRHLIGAGYDWLNLWECRALSRYAGKRARNLPPPDHVLTIPGYGLDVEVLLRLSNDWSEFKKQHRAGARRADKGSR